MRDLHEEEFEEVVGGILSLLLKAAGLYKKSKGSAQAADNLAAAALGAAAGSEGVKAAGGGD